MECMVLCVVGLYGAMYAVMVSKHPYISFYIPPGFMSVERCTGRDRGHPPMRATQPRDRGGEIWGGFSRIYGLKRHVPQRGTTKRGLGAHAHTRKFQVMLYNHGIQMNESTAVQWRIPIHFPSVGVCGGQWPLRGGSPRVPNGDPPPVIKCVW